MFNAMRKNAALNLVYKIIVQEQDGDDPSQHFVWKKKTQFS